MGGWAFDRGGGGVGGGVEWEFATSSMTDDFELN